LKCVGFKRISDLDGLDVFAESRQKSIVNTFLHKDAGACTAALAVIEAK
jgi:hypothetical protein